MRTRDENKVKAIKAAVIALSEADGFTNLTTALPEEDPDGDGLSNWQEYLSNTHPRDPLSALRLLPPALQAGSALRWPSVGGTRYRVEWTDDLATGVFHSVERPVSEELDPANRGTPSVFSFTDDFLDGPAEGKRVYRIRVLNE